VPDTEAILKDKAGRGGTAGAATRRRGGAMIHQPTGGASPHRATIAHGSIGSYLALQQVDGPGRAEAAHPAAAGGRHSSRRRRAGRRRRDPFIACSSVPGVGDPSWQGAYEPNSRPQGRLQAARLSQTTCYLLCSTGDAAFASAEVLDAPATATGRPLLWPGPPAPSGAPLRRTTTSWPLRRDPRPPRGAWLRL